MSDKHNEEQVLPNDDKSPYRSGRFRDRRMVETSSGDTNNPAHPLFKNISMPPNPDLDKNSTREKKTKPEENVGHS
jgi:hypothetical protein